MRNLTLKTKIHFLIALFVVAFSATSLLLVRELSRRAEQDNAFSTVQLDTQNSTRVIQLNFKKQVQAWKDLLLRGHDPANFKKYSDEFSEHEAEVRHGAMALAEQVPDEESRAELQRFIASHQAMGSDYRAALQKFAKSRGRDFRGADAAVKGKDRPVTDAVDEIVAHLKARSQQRQEANLKHLAARTRLLFIGIFAAAAVLISLGAYIARTINHATGELLGFMGAQASDLRAGRADLSKRLPSDSGDEFGKIADAFNAYTEALENIVSKLSQCIAQIAAASEQISTTASHSAENSRLQADQTTQVATAMEEMSATVLQVAANSQSASDAALKAAEAARSGGKVVEETVTAIGALASASDQAAERIANLGKASEKIGTIIAVIDDIADQTNLLALNAAIEAARAGETGRGFAVVADEVRKLAERTTAATKEIAGMIQAIQAGTVNSVEAISLGTQQAQAGLQKATASGAALEEIIRLASDVGSMIANIAAASTQQSAATAQVNSSISGISGLTQSSSTAAQQTAKACIDLSQLATQLENLIRGFKHADHKGLPRVSYASVAKSAAVGAG